MLSSLTAFLPSALQLHQEHKDSELLPSPVPQEPVLVVQEETDAQPQVDSIPSAKKKIKKEKIANEVRSAMFHTLFGELFIQENL